MCAVLALLGACETSGPVTDQAQVCAGWKPILISRDDLLTEATAQQIEAHNEFGASIECWKSGSN